MTYPVETNVGTEIVHVVLQQAQHQTLHFPWRTRVYICTNKSFFPICWYLLLVVLSICAPSNHVIRPGFPTYTCGYPWFPWLFGVWVWALPDFIATGAASMACRPVHLWTCRWENFKKLHTPRPLNILKPNALCLWLLPFPAVHLWSDTLFGRHQLSKSCKIS